MWTIDDVRTYLVRHPISFEATVHVVESDDLTFAWSSSDRSGDLPTIYYKQRRVARPVPSPEVNPNHCA